MAKEYHVTTISVGQTSSVQGEPDRMITAIEGDDVTYVDPATKDESHCSRDEFLKWINDAIDAVVTSPEWIATHGESPNQDDVE